MVLLRISSRLRLIIDPKPISRNRRKSQASITSIFLFRIFIKPRSECSRGRDPLDGYSITPFPNFHSRIECSIITVFCPWTSLRPPSCSSLLSISKQKKNQQTTSHMVGAYSGCLWPLFRHERHVCFLRREILLKNRPSLAISYKTFTNQTQKHPKVKRQTQTHDINCSCSGLLCRLHRNTRIRQDGSNGPSIIPTTIAWITSLGWSRIELNQLICSSMSSTPEKRCRRSYLIRDDIFKLLPTGDPTW